LNQKILIIHLLPGVLNTEYWDIDRSTGTTNGVIKLPYINPSNGTHWTLGSDPCQYCVVAVAQPYVPSSSYWYFVNGASNNGGYSNAQYIDWTNNGWIESPITSPFGTYSFGFFFNVILASNDFTFTGKAQVDHSALKWKLKAGNDYEVVDLQYSRNGRNFIKLVFKECKK
jgi:hypothetical protein